MKKTLYLLILIGLFAQAQDLNPGKGIPLDTPSHEAQGKEKPKRYTGKQDQRNQVPLLITIIDSGQPVAQGPLDSVDEQRDKEDLVAQQEMAVASIKMARYTKWSIFLSFFALAISAAIGGLSIFFSIKSLKQAKILQGQTLERMDTAEKNAERFHTEIKDQTTDINTLTLNRMDQAAADQRMFNQATLSEMIKSEKRSEKHSELEMRAYIKLHVVVHNQGVLNKLFIDSPVVYSTDYAYVVKVENVGKSPARNLSGVVAIRYDLWNAADESAFTIGQEDIETQKRETDLSPGGTRSFYRRIRVNERPDNETTFKVRSKEMGVFVFGRVYFKDVFGIDQFVNFRVVHRIDYGASKFGDAIYYYRKGNGAT